MRGRRYSAFGCCFVGRRRSSEPEGSEVGVGLDGAWRDCIVDVVENWGSVGFVVVDFGVGYIVERVLHWRRGACFVGSIGREVPLGRCFRQSAGRC